VVNVWSAFLPLRDGSVPPLRRHVDTSRVGRACSSFSQAALPDALALQHRNGMMQLGTQ